ncbi:MAG: DUF11 domain-containing protein [Coleofasciculus sp. B1-GNL1-01]|uniref:hypothetical protein n=1 Tax=Coleofasciculus sp. B1-GNL1-01 TaxID=3068484 RepID=UPI0032F58F13
MNHSNFFKRTLGTLLSLGTFFNQTIVKAQTVTPELNWSAPGVEWPTGDTSQTFQNLGCEQDVNATITIEDPLNILVDDELRGITLPDDISGIFNGGLGENVEALVLRMDTTETGQGVTVRVELDSPVPLVNFQIFDVDEDDNPPNWQDQVTVRGFNNGVEVPAPTLTSTTEEELDEQGFPDLLPSSSSTGNVALGTGVGRNDTAQGTVKVDFGEITIDEFTIFYENGPSSQPTPNNPNPDPDPQAIGLFNISFDAEADLELEKDASFSDPIIVGDELTYRVRVTNQGPCPATDVSILESLPSGLTYISDNPSQGDYDPTTAIWTLNTPIEQGNSATLDITARLNTSQPITNTAQVNTSNEFDPDSTPGNNQPSEDDQNSLTITPTPSADLSLSKTVNNTNPNVGEDLTYIVTLRNDGPDTATNVAVTEQIPAGFTFSSANPSQGDYDSNTGEWSVGSLNNGASATLELTGTVNNLPIANTAQVSASDQPDPDSTPGNDEPDEDDQASLNLPTQLADLSLTKTANNTDPSIGESLTYTVTLRNDGPDTATNVEVSEQVPPGLTFSSANPSQGNYDSNTGIWSVGNLNNGASATLALTGTVNNLPITNTAQVSASDQIDPDSTPGNNEPDEDDQARLNLPPQIADLSLSKTANNNDPSIGETLTYTVTLQNDGPDTATNVAVTEQVPEGLTFSSANPSQGSYDSNTGIWSVGNLNNGASATLALTGTVNNLPIANTAQVSASDQPDPDSTPGNNEPNEDDQASLNLPTQVADLSLSKTANNTDPSIGESLTYTVTLRNDGPNTATNVAVTEQVPEGLTFSSANPSQGSYDSNTGIWSVGTLNNGANATLQLTGTVNNLPITNTAQVSASDQIDPDSAPGNDEPEEDDQASLNLPTQIADLSLSKTADNTDPSIGESLTYTVTLRNDGPSTATNVAVTEQVPEGLTFSSANPSQGSYDSNTGIWSVGTLASGATVRLQVTGTVNNLPIANTAQVTASDQPDPDSTPGNNEPNEDDQASLNLPTQVADLSLSKTASNTNPSVGESLTYTVTLQNDGPDTATNVAVSEQVPEGLTFSSFEASQGSYDSNTGEWSVGNLNNGASATLQITAQVNTDQPVTNTAQVSRSDQLDPDSIPANGVPGEDDQASVTLPQELADLSLLKTVDSTTISPGQNITYTLILTNDGPATATGVGITERLPSGLTFVSANASRGSYDNNTGIWSVGTLASGETATVNIVATLNTTDPVTNTAEISAANQRDPDATFRNNDPNEDDQASVTIPLATQPNLRLVKRITNVTRDGAPISGINFNTFVDDPNNDDDNAPGWSQLPNGEPQGVIQIGSEASLQSGDEVEYTIYFLSDGGQAVTNIRVCDAIPEGTTFIPDSFAASRGISLQRNGSTISQTNSPDEDKGTFFSPLNSVNAPPCPNSNNPNGSVFVDLGNIRNTAPENTGFIRFRVRID